MSTRRIFWIVSFLTVVISCLVFMRFASLSKDIPDQYKIEKKLRILTYSSFVDKGSAGSYLLEQFKKDCMCKVEVVSVVDSGLLLERLRLAGNDGYDLVIGLDQIVLEKAKEFGWRQLNTDFVQADPELQPYMSDKWIPFDWSPLTFIYRKSEASASPSLQDFLVNENSQRISLEDPRTSALGQQFLLWLLSTTGSLEDLGRVLGQMNKQKFEVTASWTTAYNSFREKQTQFVFTYLTSLIFHWETEKNKDYQAQIFSAGHPFQIEYVGIPDTSKNPELAEKMIRLMLSDEGQKLIMTKNYMLPVRKSIRAGSVYEQLPEVKLLDSQNIKRNISIIQSAQDIWSKVF